MTRKFQVILLAVIPILALMSCNMLTIPQKGGITANITQPSVQSLPALTSTVTPVPPPTELAPNQTEVTTGQGAQAITPENLINLVPYSLGIPSQPRNLVFPSPSADLPEIPDSSRPDLLLLDESAMHPVLLDPPGLGMPIPIPINGSDLIAAAPDASSMFVRENDQTSLDTFSGQMIRDLNQPAQVYGASYSADSRYLAVASAEQRQVFLYDLKHDSFTELTGFETAAPVYAGLAISGGKNIAWWSRGTLQFQDVASGEMGSMLNFMDFIGPIVFSPDGTHVALYDGGQMGVYQIPSTEKVAEIGVSGFISSLSYSPDGRLLAAGHNDTLEIFDANTLASLAVFSAKAKVNHVTFSPDGRYIVTVQDDNQLTIWSDFP